MNKPSIFSAFLLFILVLCLIPGSVQLQVKATEDLSPRLILWNVQEKTGTLPVMTDDDFDNVYAVKVPVVKGTYLYRVAIGSEMKPIYGAEGKEGGKALKIEVEDNRIITFFYDPVTHNIVAEVGESFTPARRVVLVGNLQDEFGHTGGPFGGEWDPAAEMTRMQPIGNGFFTFTGTLPVGTYEYKIAIGGSWEENYGQGGKQDGPNIPVKVEQEQEITFCYNDNTHKIADSTWYVMLPEEELPRIIGDVQTTVGTDLILRDDDFDNIYSLSVSLSKGTYSYRVALGTEQQPIYGANAEQDGQPIAFSIAEDREVVMYFDANTHHSFLDTGSIADEILKHDTYDLLYRVPFEAVKTGQDVTLRLHARKGDISSAKLIVGKADITKGQRHYGMADREYEMTYLETKQLEGIGDVDFWEITLSFGEPGLYGYKFKLNNLKEYGDDTKAGGVGKAMLQGTDYFQLTVYDANLKTPNWMKEAIIYQIFPDRFFNGNKENDPVKRFARGTEPFVLKEWSELPSAPALHNDTDAFWNNDFFGGDIEGIRQKLDYLQSLGVTVLYLNPIFTAASNHKYDTTDYEHVDPYFGTEEEFLRFTRELNERGMYLILDGVFNHVGDDSIYFDRYGKYEWVGAYEYWSRVYEKMNTEHLRTEDAKVEAEKELIAEGQQLSPYNWHNWFTITNKKVQGRYEYQGWSGYDSLPVFQELGPDDVEDPVVHHESELNNQDWANYMLYDENSVAKRWFKKGISGWRLDIATEVDSEFWKEFRSEIKKITLSSGEAPVILGETWQDASHFFLGDQFDSVMNYGFRYAVQDVFLINGDAAGADAVFQSLHQNYPKEAVYALMNLIDSHDTSRAIYLLGGGEDQQVIAEKGKNFDYELGKHRLKLAVIFQMGYPGAPTIYYGDEAGLFGARDPDCRRTYPWSKEDQELLEHYRKVTTIRTTSKQLFAHGDLFTLYAEGDVYIYGRKTEDRYAVVAINRGEKTQKLAIDTQGKIVDGVTLTDQLEPSYTVIPSGNTFQLTIPPMTGKILLSQ